MKKVIKQNFTKKKIDKNTIYAYILLVFFIFWTVGSIFGFIAFGRKDKQSNVVSASANVVDDFSSSSTINLQTAYLMSPIHPVVNSNTVQMLTDDDGKYYIDIDIKNYAINYNMGYETVFPLSWFCNDLVDGTSYTLSFIYLNPDYDYYSVPKFQLFSIIDDETSDDSYFSIVQYSFDTFLYSVTFSYEEGLNYFLTLYVGDSFLADLPSFHFMLNNPAIYHTYSNPGINYVYTKAELEAIYNKELDDSFVNGATTNNAFNEGYDLGYSDALTSVNNSLQSLFSLGKCEFQIADSDIISVSPLVSSNAFYMTSTYYSVMNSLGYDVSEYLLSSGGFYFVDLPQDIVTFDSYTFNVVFPTPTNDIDISIPASSFEFRIQTTKTEYTSTVMKVDDNTYQYFIDLTSVREGERITEVWILFTGYNIITTSYDVRTTDVQYNLGFDYGYDVAYNNFVENYEEFLQEQYNKGVAYGKSVAYNEGYNDGAEASNQFTFARLLSSAIDVPINTFKSLFNFEILGVNLTNFFFSLFSISLVLAIIKLII